MTWKAFKFRLTLPVRPVFHDMSYMARFDSLLDPMISRGAFIISLFWEASHIIASAITGAICDIPTELFNLFVFFSLSVSHSVRKTLS